MMDRGAVGGSSCNSGDGVADDDHNPIPPPTTTMAEQATGGGKHHENEAKPDRPARTKTTLSASGGGGGRGEGGGGVDAGFRSGPVEAEVEVEVELDPDRPLGMQLAPAARRCRKKPAPATAAGWPTVGHEDVGCRVVAFVDVDEHDRQSQARRCGRILVGDEMSAVNGRDVSSSTFEDAVATLREECARARASASDGGDEGDTGSKNNKKMMIRITFVRRCSSGGGAASSSSLATHEEGAAVTAATSSTAAGAAKTTHASNSDATAEVETTTKAAADDTSITADGGGGLTCAICGGTGGSWDGCSGGGGAGELMCHFVMRRTRRRNDNNRRVGGRVGGGIASTRAVIPPPTERRDVHVHVVCGLSAKERYGNDAEFGIDSINSDHQRHMCRHSPFHKKALTRVRKAAAAGPVDGGEATYFLVSELLHIARELRRIDREKKEEAKLTCVVCGRYDPNLPFCRFAGSAVSPGRGQMGDKKRKKMQLSGWTKDIGLHVHCGEVAKFAPHFKPEYETMTVDALTVLHGLSPGFRDAISKTRRVAATTVTPRTGKGKGKAARQTNKLSKSSAADEKVRVEKYCLVAEFRSNFPLLRNADPIPSPTSRTHESSSERKCRICASADDLPMCHFKGVNPDCGRTNQQGKGSGGDLLHEVYVHTYCGIMARLEPFSNPQFELWPVDAIEKAFGRCRGYHAAMSKTRCAPVTSGSDGKVDRTGGKYCLLPEFHRNFQEDVFGGQKPNSAGAKKRKATAGASPVRKVARSFVIPESTYNLRKRILLLAEDASESEELTEPGQAVDRVVAGTGTGGGAPLESSPASSAKLCEAHHDDATPDRQAVRIQTRNEIVRADELHQASNQLESLLAGQRSEPPPNDIARERLENLIRTMREESKGILEVPDSKLTPWERNLKHLVLFKHEKGHCAYPLCSKENKALVSYVQSQRKNWKDYNAGQIEGSRKERFESDMALLQRIGFVWQPVEHKPWEEYFEELKAFKAEFGHVRVPQLYEKDKVNGLGNWVSKQRGNYERLKSGVGRKVKSCMTQEKIELLESIGFVWKLRHGRPKKADIERKKRKRQEIQNQSDSSPAEEETRENNIPKGTEALAELHGANNT